jgi:hypothetical protein
MNEDAPNRPGSLPCTAIPCAPASACGRSHPGQRLRPRRPALQGHAPAHGAQRMRSCGLCPRGQETEMVLGDAPVSTIGSCRADLTGNFFSLGIINKILVYNLLEE